MKKLLLIAFIASCFGCSKSSVSPGTKETFHVSVTTDYSGQKSMDVHDASATPRIIFSGLSYDGDFMYAKGTTISINCSYPSSITGHTLRVVLSKNGTVIMDQSNSNLVNIYVQSAP